MSRKSANYGYTTSNKLRQLIEAKRAEKTVEEGRKFLIRDIEKELADYCEVTHDYVQALKRGLSQPSLAVAIKIAEYFNVNVEFIFTLVEKEDD